VEAPINTSPLYKAAGVDIDAGNALVKAIKLRSPRSTRRPGADARSRRIRRRCST
jgi:phosphoribosylaminoimidazole (AIR) synthetase